MEFEEYELYEGTLRQKRLVDMIDGMRTIEDTIIVRKDGKAVAVIVDWDTFRNMKDALHRDLANRIARVN